MFDPLVPLADVFGLGLSTTTTRSPSAACRRIQALVVASGPTRSEQFAPWAGLATCLILHPGGDAGVFGDIAGWPLSMAKVRRTASSWRGGR